MDDNLSIALRYHQAVADGATGAALARFFDEDVVQQELPNLLSPEGAQRDLTGLLQAAERGATLLTHQDFEVVNAIAAGDRVALEVRWTGETKDGRVLRAHIATFLDFRNGRIHAQRNYDCYDPP
ncbi:nuclear transport factor 2 family protein [Spongiactinospora sp. 9N601]|uniref:nuclear transport factor 2 family protein n=1 Tax=Spongiactinospora sp. 9N601 TaxID=3375149 RepID=UPI0037B66352